MSIATNFLNYPNQASLNEPETEVSSDKSAYSLMETPAVSHPIKQTSQTTEASAERAITYLRALSNNCQYEAIRSLINDALGLLNPEDTAKLLNEICTQIPENVEQRSKRLKIASILDKVIAEQQERSRRPPLSFKRIRQAFRGREANLIPLSDVQAQGFSQRKIAQNALAHMDKELHKYGYHLAYTSMLQILSLR